MTLPGSRGGDGTSLSDVKQPHCRPRARCGSEGDEASWPGEQMMLPLVAVRNPEVGEDCEQPMVRDRELRRQLAVE